MPIDPESNARELVAALSPALRQAWPASESARSFVESLVLELDNCVPTLNSPGTSNVAPSQTVQNELFERPTPEVVQVMDCLKKTVPNCAWFRADSFYPETRHREFSEKLWGAWVLGQGDAMFGVDDRLVTLLVLMESNTMYPLHAHRIEELYLVLSGDAEWSRDGVTWERLNPGMVFHNCPWDPHAMRTGKDELFALGFYLPPFEWEGGLVEEQSP